MDRLHPISPATYGLIMASRQAITTLRAAAQAEMTIGGDYCRRQAALMREQAARIEAAIVAVNREPAA